MKKKFIYLIFFCLFENSIKSFDEKNKNNFIKNLKFYSYEGLGLFAKGSLIALSGIIVKKIFEKLNKKEFLYNNNNYIYLEKPKNANFINLSKISTINNETKEKIKLFSKSALSIYNNESPNFIFLNGRENSGKKFIAYAISEELNVPILYLNPFYLDDNSFSNITIEKIIKYSEINYPCIIYIDKIEYFSNQFINTLFLTLNKIKSSKPVLIIIGIENSTILIKQKVNNNKNCLIVNLNNLELEEREKIVREAIEYSDINIDLNINYKYIATILKNYNAGEINSIIKKAIKFKLLKNEKDTILKEIDILNFIKNLKLEESKLYINADIKIDDLKNETNNSFIVEKPDINFSNIIGYEHIKKAIYRIIKFLKNPNESKKFGIRMPKGMLFSGDPGCGKTLMAKAIAGECDLSFIYVKGSEFINKYVGVGAEKVREIFSIARLNKPCIICIDEIDAIAQNRDNLTNDNTEYIQTINELLTQIGGYENDEEIFIIGLTNMPKKIDPALLRSGRLEMHFNFSKPTYIERIQLLELYLKNKKIEESISIDYLAQKTIDFSGADIEYFLNNASLIALENNHEKINWNDLEDSYNQITSGYPLYNIKVSDSKLLETAYHEAGHAICKIIQKNYPLSFDSVTIVPRDLGTEGIILGFARSFPYEDLNSYSKEQLEMIIISLFGGIVAEEIILGKIMDGSGSDLKKATNIAINMICKLGMGKNIISKKTENLSDDIKEEVKEILYRCKEKCKEILNEYKDSLKMIAEKLIENKTLSKNDIEKIINYNISINNLNNEIKFNI